MKNFVDTRNHSTTLSLDDTKAIFRALLEVTKYCHEQRIVVRSLTPSNIALKKISNPANNSPHYDVKIADFSQSVAAGSFKVLCDHPLFDWHDVPFMAPEALLGESTSVVVECCRCTQYVVVNLL